MTLLAVYVAVQAIGHAVAFVWVIGELGKMTD